MQPTKILKNIQLKRIAHSSSLLNWDALCVLMGYQRTRNGWEPTTPAEFTNVDHVDVEFSKNLESRRKFMERSSVIGSYPGIEPLLLDAVVTCEKRSKMSGQVYRYLFPQCPLLPDYTLSTDDVSVMIMKKTSVSYS